MQAALGLELIQALVIEELLRQSMPPDEDMADLIERAFLEGQIDGLKADLAHCYLAQYRWFSEPSIN